MSSKKVVVTALVVFGFSFSASAENLGEWLAINEPRVIGYLQSLKKEDENKILAGVQLSDGRQELKGYKYIGRVSQLPKKTNIHIVQSGSDYIAYIWIEEGGGKLSLPPCVGKDPRSNYPGWSGSAISGDAYTYADVHSGSGVVVTYCPLKEWVSGVR